MNYFVTGTDTGVGKTLVSCALLHAFSAQGNSVVGMKPVAAGCDEDGLNEDVKKLRATSSILATLGQINPYSFDHSIAPHLASQYFGVKINLDRILVSYKELSSQAEVVIIEGAGGFLVPLNDQENTADLAIALGLPIILVVGMRLGCLNHALLSQLAIDHYGLHCAGWVANVIDQDMPSLNENIKSLQRLIKYPLIGTINHQTQFDAHEASTQLNIHLLEEPSPDL
jgi:dethiobiotin synthetase